MRERFSVLMVIRKMYTPNKVLKSKAEFDKYREAWWFRVCYLSTWEVEAEGQLQVQGQSGLHCETLPQKINQNLLDRHTRRTQAPLEVQEGI